MILPSLAILNSSWIKAIVSDLYNIKNVFILISIKKLKVKVRTLNLAIQNQ
jgi:hypothetical protein